MKKEISAMRKGLRLVAESLIQSKVEEAKEITSKKDSEERLVLEMFGTTIERLESGLKRAKEFGYTRTSYAISILSDAQELIANGHLDDAIKFINRAKYFMNQS